MTDHSQVAPNDETTHADAPNGAAPVETAEPKLAEGDEGADAGLARRFKEQFAALLPTIQERWPGVAREALRATRGSLDEVAGVIAARTGGSTTRIRHQLHDLLHASVSGSRDLADNLEPLERQLEQLLDELNSTLRPRIERPVRNRPLLALGVAAGVGFLAGLLLSLSRRRSS